MSVAEPAERSYRGYRFPPEIIAHAVWLYFRFQIQDAFPDGVFFVSLGEVKVASLVAPELAQALGTVETGANLEAQFKTLKYRLEFLDGSAASRMAAPCASASSAGTPMSTTTP